MVRGLRLAFALAFALALAAPAAADSPRAETLVPAAALPTNAPPWAYELAAELMSPFCPGRTLADCPSPNAASIRMWIVVQAASGRTRDDVQAELYERYGDVMRPAPRAEGFGLTAYLVPIGAFAAGGLLVALVLRRMTRRGAAPAQAVAAPRPLDPELERRVDEELAR
ncbi:MAG TPA: cytochrome c-type biogenesis protein CcmH [Myxococcota bacterium]|jgi:cytochrome c-type biogenesis protein CcmH/NrfF|nr:cytochrome c-type biogenesis protein CcmH [Myxococcota bacterium]